MLKNTLYARSISLRASRLLRTGVSGRVLASFERVCDLVTDNGEVVALVWNGVGDGPLNVVLSHGQGVDLPAGAGFAVCGEGGDATRLTLESPADGSPIVIVLAAAIPWNPHPDWDHLRARKRQIAAGAEAVAGILAKAGWTLSRCGLPEALCKQTARGQADAVRALVGLGPGLTPAGDDWLAGWLLAQHLAPGLTGLRNLSGLVGKMAAGRTTTLSRALLACAAAGEADAAWHALLAALAEEPMASSPIHRSTTIILSQGATSGAAMLTGFCTGVAHLTPDVCSLIPDTRRGLLCLPSPTSDPLHTTTP
jgi:hypothetical protein